MSTVRICYTKLKEFIVQSLLLPAFIFFIASKSSSETCLESSSNSYCSSGSYNNSLAKDNLNRYKGATLLILGPRTVLPGEVLKLQAKVEFSGDPRLRRSLSKDEHVSLIGASNSEKLNENLLPKTALQSHVERKLNQIGYFKPEQLPVYFQDENKDKEKEYKSPNYVYELVQAPKGAQIDRKQGQISWVADNRREHEIFTISVRDENNIDFILVETIKIKVILPVDYFGYDYFLPARESIIVRRKTWTNQIGPNGRSYHVRPQFEGKSSDKDISKCNSTSKESDLLVSDELPDANQDNFSDQVVCEDDNTQTTSLEKSFPRDLYIHEYEPANAMNYVGPDQMLNMNVMGSAPERYHLGPGDTIHVKYWSETFIAKEEDLVVDESGKINVPITSRSLSVRGQTLDELKTLLIREIGAGLKNPKVQVTLKKLKTISITVAGESFAPGTYRVPSVSTLFNVLYATGGPKRSGSLREIQVKRSGGSALYFDFYNFLLSGDTRQDIPLYPGDVIFIPPVTTRVTVKGEVKRESIYELKAGEGLKQILEFAGGLKASAVAQRVSIDSIKPGMAKKLYDVDLTDHKISHNIPLYDNDVIEVLSVRQDYSNSVTLKGEVDQPGKYELTDGMTIAGLINKARGPLDTAYRERADIFRLNPDGTRSLLSVNLQQALLNEKNSDIFLKKNDEIIIYHKKDVDWLGDRHVTIEGAVVKPGTYPRLDNLRIRDLLVHAGGLTGDAYREVAFIQRYEENGITGPLVKVNLNRAFALEPEHNILLNNKDIVKIQSIKESSYIPEQTVKIMGAVQKPGTYPRASNMTIMDLLQLAGGVLPNASNKIEISHATSCDGISPKVLCVSDIANGSSKPDIYLKDGDIISVPQDSDIISAPRLVTVLGAVKHPGTYSIINRGERLSSLISRAGGLIENAFPEGAQLIRDNVHLSTLAQSSLTSRVMDIFEQINVFDFIRSYGVEELQKLELTKGAKAREESSRDPLTYISQLGALLSKQQPKNGSGNQSDSNTAKDLIFATKNLKSPSKSISCNTVPSIVTPARLLDQDDITLSGNVNINLKLAMKDAYGKNDLPLKEKDVVIVPFCPSTVSVIGGVLVPSAVSFAFGEQAAYYIKRAGGLTSDASRKHFIVMKPNGSVVKISPRKKLELGDLLFVPTKVMVNTFKTRSITDELDKGLTSLLNTALIVTLIRGSHHH